MAVTMSEDENDANSHRAEPAHTAASTTTARKNETSFANSFWNMMNFMEYSGNEREVDWKATDMSEEYAMALLDTSLLSGESGRSQKNQREQEDTITHPPTQSTPSVFRKAPRRVIQNDDDENDSFSNEGAAVSLQISESSLQPSEQTPPLIGQQAFTTFRKNAANIALEESNAYLSQIQDLEDRLEVALSEAQLERSQRLQLEEQVAAQHRQESARENNWLEKPDGNDDRLQRENLAMRQELGEKNQNLMSVTAELSSLKSHVEEFRRQGLSMEKYQSAMDDNERLKQELLLLRSKEQTNVERYLSLQAKLSKMEWKTDQAVEAELLADKREQEIHNLMRDLESGSLKHQSEKQDLEAEIQKQASKIEELTTSLDQVGDEYRRERDALLKDLKSRDDEIATLRPLITACEQYRAEAERVRGKLFDKDSIIDKLQSDYVGLSSIHNEKLKEHEVKIRELETSSTREKDAVNKERLKIESELQACVEENQAKIAELERSVVLLTEEKDGVSAINTELKNQIRTLRDEVSALEESKTSLNEAHRKSLSETKKNFTRAVFSFEKYIASLLEGIADKTISLDQRIVHVGSLLNIVKESIEVDTLANDESGVLNESTNLRLMEEARHVSSPSTAVLKSPKDNGEERGLSSLQFSERDDSMSSIAGISHMFERSVDVSVHDCDEQQLLNPFSEVEALKTKLAEVDEDRLNLVDRLEQSMQRNAELNRDLENVKQMLLNAESESSRLRNNSRGAENRVSTLEDELFEANAKVLELRECCDRLENETNARATEIKVREKEIDAKDHQINTLTTQLADATVALTKANEEKAVVGASLRDLETTLKRQELLVESQSEEILFLNKQLGDSIAQHARAIEERNELVKSHDELRVALSDGSSNKSVDEQRIFALSRQLEEAQLVANEMVNAREDLLAKCASMEKSIDDKNELLEFEFEKVSQLEIEIQELQKWKTSASTQQGDLIRAQETVGQLQESLSEKDELLEGLREELTSERETLRVLRSECEELRTKLKTGEELFLTNKACAEAAETLAHDTETRLIEQREELFHLKEMLATVEEENEMLQNELSEANEKVSVIERLHEKNDILVEKIEAKEAKIQKLEQSIRAMDEDSHKIGQQHAECIRSLQIKSARLAKLETKCSRLRHFVQQLTEKCESWESFHRDQCEFFHPTLSVESSKIGLNKTSQHREGEQVSDSASSQHAA